MMDAARGCLKLFGLEQLCVQKQAETSRTHTYLLKRLSPIRYCRRCTTSLLKAGESQLWRLSR